MLLTLNKLCEITGKDRKTIAPRLADVPFKPGPNKAQLYESAEALTAIYTSSKVSFDEARTRQALSQEALNNLRADDVRRTRIPIAIPVELWDAALQAFTSTLKAARGRKLEPKLINDLLGKLRVVKLPLKW